MATIEDFDRMPEPPDLQKLVRTAGGYARITAAQWDDFDYRMERTLKWLREHHKQINKWKPGSMEGWVPWDSKWLKWRP